MDVLSHPVTLQLPSVWMAYGWPRSALQGAVGLRNRPSTSFKRGLPVCTFLVLASSVGLGTSQHLAGRFIGLSSSRCFRALENAAVHHLQKNRSPVKAT